VGGGGEGTTGKEAEECKKEEIGRNKAAYFVCRFLENVVKGSDFTASMDKI
jgi:hypothetical protein